MRRREKKGFSGRRKGADYREDEQFILLGKNASFAVTEAYKTLRTNVMFSLPAEEDRGKLIGITSVNKGEGKSTNSINLALSIAELGKKVLYLDCDLRRSMMEKRLNLSAVQGLSNILVGLCEPEDAILPFGDTGLDIISAGEYPPNPSEILESARMRELCDMLSRKYDYIIADLPPAGVLSDALIVSKYIDGIIIVVRQEYSESGKLKEVVRQLKFAQAKILGFIFCDHTEKQGGKYGREKAYSYGTSRSAPKGFNDNTGAAK